jgi:drug/metabolite transporter (DMT)-like permease
MNGVMWGLFTKALTLATSTVRVSVINTSANFVVTALLGAIVFGESLPGESLLPSLCLEADDP